MSLLLLLLALVGGLAILVEAFNLFGREFFFGGRAQEAIKESIRKTQSELRAADKKLDSLRATRRGVMAELDRVVSKVEELDKEFRRTPDIPPALIHSIASTTGFGTRYRAKLTKKLPEDADEHQTLIWKHDAFVDVIAGSADDAASAAKRQFPESHGYTVGPFKAMDAVESAA